MTGEVSTRPRRTAVTAVAACALLASSFLLARGARPAEAGTRATSSIVGGKPADFADWPFVAGIFFKGRLSCGGSVIAPTRILTAGHCVKGAPVGKLTVATGRYRITDTSSGESRAITGYQAHPNFAFRRPRHDVAVITLASPVSAPAVTLPTEEEAAAATPVGARLRVAGWGAREPFARPFRPGVLKQAFQRVLRPRRCRRPYGKPAYSPAFQICALGKRNRRFSRRYRRIRRFIPWPIHDSTCIGDSGGPLMADTANGARQVGVVSFGGVLCGGHQTPNVFARVGPNLDFIKGAAGI